MEFVANVAGSDFVVFDVIGVRYRLKKTLFNKYAKSLFFKLINKAEESVEICTIDYITKLNADEYYVQRCPDLFKIVVEYCINGKLHVPAGICSDQVAEEFHFWTIQYEDLCKNCASHHYHSEAKVSVDKATLDEACLEHNYFPYSRQRLWFFMNHPHSGLAAFVFFIVSVAVIVLSILNIIIASIPELQYCPKSNTSDQADDDRKARDEADDFRPTDCVGTFVFNIIDMFCMSWFSLELLLRLVSCPNYKKFFLSAFFFIDFLSILPFYVELLIYSLDTDESDDWEKLKSILVFLRIFKLFRIFQILKYARYSLSLIVLGKTLKSAKADLGMLLAFILSALLIFSNFVYQFEKDTPNSLFTSIPATFWWCIVTLTTVGYGDMYPQTILGKIVGGLACVCGVLLIAFPIAILVDKFMKTYKEEKEKDQEKHRRKRFRYVSTTAAAYPPNSLNVNEKILNNVKDETFTLIEERNDATNKME